MREKGEDGEEEEEKGEEVISWGSSSSTDRINASRFYVLSLIKFGVGSRKNMAPTRAACRRGAFFKHFRPACRGGAAPWIVLRFNFMYLYY